MTKSARLRISVLLWIGAPLLAIAQVANQTQVRPDYSQEPVVLEQSSDKFKFQNDGTSTRELYIRARVQSDAGVQQLGMLKFSYQSSSESLAVDFVRVCKSDGRVVVTPVVRKNSIRLPSDRDAGTYLFGFPALGSPKNQSCEQKMLLSRADPVQS